MNYSGLVHVDPAAALRPLTPQEDEFLRALARTLLFIPRTFEADLGREHGLSSSQYFALMHLSEAPSQRLRMGELAAATALTLPATTRVVKCLEDRGLVERQPAAADGRGQDAVLTSAGRTRLDDARPRHIASVRRHIFDKLEGLDLEPCIAALSRIGRDRDVERTTT